MTTHTITSIKEYIQQRRQEVEDAIWRLMPKPEGHTNGLIEAMRYPLEAGGKRIRPIFVLAGADFCRGVKNEDIFNGNYWNGVEPDLKEALLSVACSIEMLHTYSLVHDDLPCMDDDDLRRGRPTSHVVYGEANAVLSGDALHTFGFQLISSIPEKFATQAFHVVRELAVACGYQGMVAGQVIDLEYESKPGNEEVLEFIHLHKTAALIRAALLMGARMVDASESDYRLLFELGNKLGLIFQVVDDILDVVGDSQLLGKNTGADQDHHKLTYPALIGLESSKKRVDQLHSEIVELLKPAEERSKVLLDITQEMVQRNA